MECTAAGRGGYYRPADQSIGLAEGKAANHSAHTLIHGLARALLAAHADDDELFPGLRPGGVGRSGSSVPQVIDMGDGCAQMLETVIGCTLDDAFALLAGRGFCPPIVHPPEKAPPSTTCGAGWKARTRLGSGTSRKRLKGLEPSTFCMASRP